MFPAFTHLPLSTGYVLVSLFSCDPKAAPDVTIQFKNNPPQISNTRSSAYLLGLKGNAVSPNYGGEFPNLDGLTNGVFQLKYDLLFTNTEQTLLDTACVQTKAAHIVITYTPIVYISSSTAPGSCRYTTTLEHEMRHVNTDIATIKEYIPYIKTVATLAIMPEHKAQPIEKSREKAVQDDISEKLSQALQDATDVLQQTRTNRQRQIDSRQEYERLSRACPDENTR